MSLTNLLNNVQEITKRPDARARGILALNQIIMEVCIQDDYPEDLIETSIASPTPESPFAVLPLLIPGFPGVRKIAYLTVHDRPLRSVSPRNAIDSCGQPACSVYYQSGKNLIVNAPSGFTSARIGYYQVIPYITEDVGQDTHWLMDSYESMLEMGTLARVFRATGDDVSADKYEAMYQTARHYMSGGLSEAQ